MNIPDKKKLLNELNKSGYRERIKKMSLLGKEFRGNDKFKALLDSLDGGDVYENSLSIAASISSGDDERLISYLKKDSTFLRNRALSGLPVKDDEKIWTHIDNIPINTRKLLLKKISLMKEKSLSEKLFPYILEKYGYKESLYLLSSCSAETLEKYLPELGDRIFKWENLTRSHGETVLSYIKKAFSLSPEREYLLLWSRFSEAIKILIDRKAGDILHLALKYSPPDVIPSVIENNAGILLKKEQSLLFNLLTGSSYKRTISLRGLPAKLLKHIRRLSKEQILTLALMLRESPENLAELLKALPPSMRGEIFTGAYEGINTENYEWPHNLLEVLPCEIRHREAERMLNLKKIKEDHNLTLEITAFCDIEHVRNFFYNATKVPKAEERGKVLNLLVKSTGLYRKGLKETLSYLERIKNDQDPVRLDVFQGLLLISPSLFKEEHIEHMEKMINSVLEARDTSYATLSAVEKLSVKILIYNGSEPESKLFGFSLDILKKLARKAGYLSLLPCIHNIPEGTEVKLVEALKPVIISFNERESYNLILSLVRCLGKRGWYIKSLQDMLEPVVYSKPDYNVSHAIELWLAPPKTRDERVWKLIKKDRSVITVRSVFEHIHRHRQEWLDYFLDGKGVKGRFLTGKTIYVMPAVNGFYRWLPAQQRKFAVLLHRLAGDKGHSAWIRCNAIKKLALLPSVTLKEITEYLKYDDVNIIEAALGSLSNIDNPFPALPVLIEYLDGDRARVAMYTIPACIPFISPESIMEIFKEILSGEKLKVTVHKEIIRLSALYSGDSELSLLKNEWEKEDLHRDVRIAVLHAARQRLEKPAAWELLQKGASSSDEHIVLSLLDQRPEGLSLKEKQSYVKLILHIAEHGNLKVRKAAFSSLPLWSSGSEEIIAGKAAEIIINIEEGQEWREALYALLSSCRDGKSSDTVVLAVKSLSACSPDKYNCLDSRDIPSFQRLSELVELFITMIPWQNRLKLKGLFQELADIMNSSELWIYRVKLLVSSLPWDNPSECAGTVIKLAEEVKETFFLNYITETIRLFFRKEIVIPEIENTLKIINMLMVSEHTQLIALTLLDITGEHFKWPSECKEILRNMRKSSSPVVRAEALRIWTVRD